ncbi:hypothetical protein HPP92_014196 [Vanilla planifolia]|uniref:Uncharacterized protein n=1 Tax=Vanilla planifolia TaxID=51239 RepID=A0A835QQG8_VANPL|nr:hypothetical protein HPP92_014196 [Vanilla planifolia]
MSPHAVTGHEAACRARRRGVPNPRPMVNTPSPPAILLPLLFTAHDSCSHQLLPSTPPPLLSAAPSGNYFKLKKIKLTISTKKLYPEDE